MCPLLRLCCVLRAHVSILTLNGFHSEAKSGPLTWFASCPCFWVLSFVILIIFPNWKSGLHLGLVFLPTAHIQLLIHALLIFPLEISLPVPFYPDLMATVLVSWNSSLSWELKTLQWNVLLCRMEKQTVLCAYNGTLPSDKQEKVLTCWATWRNLKDIWAE